VNANLLVHREVIPSFFLLFPLPPRRFPPRFPAPPVASDVPLPNSIRISILSLSFSFSLALFPRPPFSTLVPPSSPFSLVGPLAFLACDGNDGRPCFRSNFPDGGNRSRWREPVLPQSARSLYPLTEVLRVFFFLGRQTARLATGDCCVRLCRTASRID